jgi:uncharacterized protein (DUF58 family)
VSWLRRAARAPLRLLARLRPPRRLRLTREGRYFIAITVGIGLAAINTGNNLLYLVLGWMLSLIIASGMLSDVSMRGLRVTRRPPPRVFARRPFLMEIAVENRKEKLASYSIEIEDLVAGRPLDKRCYFLKIPAGRTQRTSYRHTFARRGRQRFDGFRIATKFPFALFHKSRRVTEAGEAIVYPAIVPVALPSPRARAHGETATRIIGRRGDFFGLREYRDGDDRRAIHWRSSARTGNLMVREYEKEAQRRASVFVDNALPDGHPDADDDPLDGAVSTAASLAAAYLAAGYGVRLVARGLQLPFGAGEAHLDRILRALALLPPAAESDEFAGPPSPGGENLLVAPRDLPELAGRPAACHRVEEAA